MPRDSGSARSSGLIDREATSRRNRKRPASEEVDDDERLMREALREHMRENPEMELAVDWIREITEVVVQYLGDEENAFDDVHGGTLPAEKVIEARDEEVTYMVGRDIWTEKPVAECWEKTGKPPVSIRWVDTNKGDDQKRNYRSRMVVKEFKGKYKGLSAAELFSSMPPLEALKLLASLMVSKKVSKRNRPLKLAVIDISRAHMYGVAQRKVYVQLPEEDQEEASEVCRRNPRRWTAGRGFPH